VAAVRGLEKLAGRRRPLAGRLRGALLVASSSPLPAGIGERVQPHDGEWRDGQEDQHRVDEDQQRRGDAEKNDTDEDQRPQRQASAQPLASRHDAQATRGTTRPTSPWAIGSRYEGLR